MQEEILLDENGYNEFMKEYEYSFKVKSIKPYIDYCISNNYKEVNVVKQNRIIFENKNIKNIIARITINDKNEISLDFKKVCNNKEDLNISKESIPIKFTKNNIENIKSILDVLEFYETANNIRIRYIYELNGVKFEIDDYINPKMQVVAIEGEKEIVDKVYNDIKRSNLW